MDNLVINFDVSTISQNWNSFRCNSNNGSFSLNQEINFLTISDFLQNTFINLITFPVNSFAFPISMHYQLPPLTGAECLFNEFVTNGVYVSLPQFRSLKANVMNPIIYNNVNTKVGMLIVFMAQILIVGTFVVGMLLLNKRVTELKHESYDLF